MSHQRGPAVSNAQAALSRCSQELLDLSPEGSPRAVLPAPEEAQEGSGCPGYSEETPGAKNSRQRRWLVGEHGP